MTKDEIVLQLTLKVLENFEYDSEEYGGTPKLEQAVMNAELAASIFNGIQKNLTTEVELKLKV